MNPNQSGLGHMTTSQKIKLMVALSAGNSWLQSSVMANLLFFVTYCQWGKVKRLHDCLCRLRPTRYNTHVLISISADIAEAIIRFGWTVLVFHLFGPCKTVGDDSITSITTSAERKKRRYTGRQNTTVC